jgi:hypothetical protein
MKPIALIAFPVGLYVVVSLLFNNMLAWQEACGVGLSCSPSLVLISQNSLLFLLVTGQFAVAWSLLIPPTMDWSILGSILSLIVGAILMFLSLGMTINVQVLSTGASFGGGHEQGGKLLQGIGIGMLIWGMTLATIGGWEGYLDGIAAGMSTLFNLLLEICFCIGVVWLTQTRF